MRWMGQDDSWVRLSVSLPGFRTSCGTTFRKQETWSRYWMFIFKEIFRQKVWGKACEWVFFVLDNYLYSAICIENLLSHNIHSLCLKHKKKNVIAVMVYFRVCSVALSKAAVKLLPANVAWKLASSSCFQSQLPSIIANTFETKCDMQLSAKGDVITGCNSFSLLLPPEHFQSCPEE